MVGNVFSKDATIEAVKVVNDELTVGYGVDHVIVNPAEMTAFDIPFANSFGFHVEGSDLVITMHSDKFATVTDF